MLKPQALALLAAIEGQKVPCSVMLSFAPTGDELWTVAIPPEAALTGPQLAALAQYCAQNALTLSATFSYLGVS